MYPCHSQSFSRFLLTFALFSLTTQPTLASNPSLVSSQIRTTPSPQNPLISEIRCYSLPYGGIGFASHILTYYTIAMLALSRRPYMPFLRNQHSKIDIFLAIIGLVVAIIISTVTIVRCKKGWQFVAMAAWKLDISVVLGFLSCHAAVIVKSKVDGHGEGDGEEEGNVRDGKRERKVLFWLLLYIPGVAAGLTGLFSLVGQTIGSNKEVKIVTGVFGGITLMVALLCGWVVYIRISNGQHDAAERALDPVFASGLSGFAVCLGCFAVLGAFYSDWILAAIADNLAGTPSSDNAALYWSYFIAKRLPFFSS